jgi:integrase
MSETHVWKRAAIRMLSRCSPGARMRLTVKSAATVQLPPGKTDHVYFDDDIAGFGLRIREGGSRTWVYRYRIGRKQRGITLGSATSVPLALARTNAGALEAKVRLGHDPIADKQAARAEAGNTVGALIDQYLDARACDWRPNSARQVRRHLLSYAKPLHAMPVTALSQRDVATLLGAIAKNSGDISANRLRASLETFVGWVIRQGIRLPEGNVVSYTEKRKERSRSRVLTDADLRAVWNACDDTDHGAIVKLLLLTGQRAAEIGSLRWDEVHADRIELPGDRTKNKRPHVVPLNATAVAILEPLRMAGRVHVFGRDDSHGFRGWGVSKQRLDQRIAKSGATIAPWVVHDLRRSAASGMQRLGIRVEVIERVLNHTSGSFRGVAGVYQRDPLSADVRDALERWARHVTNVVAGRNQTIVPMKRRGA